MADTRSFGHTDEQRIDTVEEDPFAELSRLIDRPLVSSSAAGRPDLFASAMAAASGKEKGLFSAGDLHGFEAAPPATDAAAPGGLDVDDLADALDAELTGSFLDEVAVESTSDGPLSPRVATVEPANGVVPKGEGPSMRAGSHVAVKPVEMPVDSDLQLALRGLSAPMNPRGAAPHQSEAFAPARSESSLLPEAVEKPFDDFDELIASELAAMKAAPATMDDGVFAQVGPGPAEAALPVAVAARGGGATGVVEPQAAQASVNGVAPEVGKEPAVGGRGAVGSTGRRLAASVLAIAVVGAAGAYWVSADGRDGSEDLLIVRADTDPVKVAPKDPGGRAIPNQNKAVYERVQSADAEIAPAQQTLVTAAEEPVDLPGVDLSPISSARAAEPKPVAAASNDRSPIAVLTPRRVRTMTVRPDGTLVVSNAVPATSMDDVRDSDSGVIKAAAHVVPAATGAVSVEPEGRGSGISLSSSGVPVPGARPGSNAEASVRVAAVRASESMSDATSSNAAAEVKAPEAVGSITSGTGPEPAAEAAQVVDDAYFVQISSQPSEAAAKETSHTLGKRYAEVIGPRDLVIQSADIPGKGVFYRVRIATGSKAEASTLCTQLKSAGGSCFVAR